LSKTLSADLRSSGGGLIFFVNLEKWISSNLSCLIVRPNWPIKILLLTKERIEVGIEIKRFLVFFQKCERER